MGNFMDAVGNVAQTIGQYAQSPAGNLFSTLGTTGLGVMNAYQQYKRQQMLDNPAKTLMNMDPRISERVRQDVEGQQMGATGSGTPALVARGEADVDWQIRLQQLQDYMNSILGGASLQSPTGSLEQLIAQATGGLGHSYATSGFGDPTLNQAWGNVLADPNSPFSSGDPSLDAMSKGFANSFIGQG